MTLLTKREYLDYMRDEAIELDPSEIAWKRVCAYATKVLPSLNLEARKIRTGEMKDVYQHGEKVMFHIKAFPRKSADTLLIVVGDAEATKLEGHILIDLLAEYTTPMLACPSFDFSGPANPELIQQMVTALQPNDEDPWAILETGDGTFIQTLCTEDGYTLEHQLVNSSSHYEVPERLTAEVVVEAMISYGFGMTEWLDKFAWQKQEL